MTPCRRGQVYGSGGSEPEKVDTPPSFASRLSGSLAKVVRLVHSTSPARAAPRARVAGGAEEPLLARHVRSSTRRTRTRSPRLSLRLRERLCSRRAVGRRPLVSTNSGHVFAADPVAACVRKEPRPTAKKARQRGRAPSVPAIAARSIQRFASLSAVAGSSWCRSRGRWAAVRPQARRGFAGASRHR